MNVTVNGKPRTVAHNGEAMQLPAFLDAHGVNPKLVAVAINGDVIEKESYAATVVRDGDALEIVRMVGGGTLTPRPPLPQGERGEHSPTMIVIIGGGIVGLACAYELRKAGADVTLLEYGRTGMQATNAAAGVLAPVFDAHRPGALLEAGLRAMREYPAVVEELESACGFDVELNLRGLLHVGFTDGEVAELQRDAEWQRSIGREVEWLDQDDCHEVEPRLSGGVLGGILTPGDGNVSNQLLALAFERAAVAHGATVMQGAAVVGFRREGRRITGVRTRDGDYGCDAVVLAAGARSQQIARKISADAARFVPVRPVRGQMVAFGGMQPPVHYVVSGLNGYVVPRANGIIFAGATVEDVGFRRRTTKAGVRAMRAMAIVLVPQLEHADVVFEWAGLRPGTPDGLPIIGPLPGYDNVIAATGHYRSGILLGPLTGKLVACGTTRGDWSETPEEFSPSRFVR